MNRLEKVWGVVGGIALVSAAACGGGGGGGGETAAAVEGLSFPGGLTVAPPVDGAVPPPAGSPAQGFPASADYHVDEPFRSVRDPAADSARIADRILRVASAGVPKELANEAPYLAQLDPAARLASSNRNASGRPTGRSLGGSVEHQVWAVESTRPAAGAPHTVGLWGRGSTDSTTLFVDALLRASPSSTAPFGSSTTSYARIPDTGGNLADPAAWGVLATTDALPPGLSGLTLYESSGDVQAVPLPGESSYVVQAVLERFSDGSRGRAHVFERVRFDDGGGDSGIQPSQHLVAFDATHLVRSTDGGAAVAYRRDAFTETVHGYGLYHADGEHAGERVELASGVGFRRSGGEYGWMGHYGAWLAGGGSLSHGETVTRDVYGQAVGEAVAFTVFAAPGRLSRYLRRTLDLADLGGRPFQQWVLDPSTGTTTVHRVEYFPASGTWEQVATLDPETNRTTPQDPPVVLDTAALGALVLWSDGLGGRVVHVHGETVVAYYETELVTGADPVLTGVPSLELFGLVGCLASGITAAEAEAGDVHLPDAPGVGQPHRFELGASDLTLYHDTDGLGTLAPVGLVPGQAPATGSFTWGMVTGPLVTGGDLAGLTDVHDAWTLPEFYAYETGHNPWNRYVGLRDGSGRDLSIPAPLRFSYVHAQAADRNDDPTYDGWTFLLSYGRFGGPLGFPVEGEDVDGDGADDRFRPIVALVDGLELVDVSGARYVVKALEVEQHLQEEPGYSGPLRLVEASDLVLPDGAAYAVPDRGPEPVVLDPPRVVRGEVAE